MMSTTPFRRRPTQLTPAGLVFNVQRCSFHDGPGIRTTVFFKGCPLRCPWCHNPEGIASAAEVMVAAQRCLGCGGCASVCPRRDGPLPAGAELGSDDCLACRRCFAACPTEARQVAGREVTVDDLVAELLRDRQVFATSGGGVTFSGGEPLAQAEFLLACLGACRSAGLHVAVDTCGLAPRPVALAVARHADLLLWDVKHLDPRRHHELTGAPLEPILGNLAAAASCGVPIWLRMPVIPGVNDDDENLAALARLAAATPHVERLSLLPYHPLALAKLDRLGRGAAGGVAVEPSPGRMSELAGRVVVAGVATTVGG